VGPGEERQHPLGHRAAVEHVPGEHHVRAVRVAVELVAEQRRHRHPVGARVQVDRGHRVLVDLVGRHRGGAGQRRRDRDQTAARGEVEHVPPGDRRGMVEQVAGERLAARPGERPERRRPLGAGDLLGAHPQPDGLVGKVQPHLGHERGGPQRGVCGHEVAPGHGVIVAARHSGLADGY
jgi:hypothetical protein